MFAISSQPYYDSRNQCYKNIVTINQKPKGPLAALVVNVKFQPLSPFKQPSPCAQATVCGLGLKSLDTRCGCGDLMTVDEIPNLFSFLVTNGYKIDTSITKMMNASDVDFQSDNSAKLITFVSYCGN